MDNLSLQFAEAAALQDVDRCTNLEDLKKLTKLLIKGHFQSRGFMATLMKQNLEEMTRVPFHERDTSLLLSEERKVK